MLKDIDVLLHRKFLGYEIEHEHVILQFGDRVCGYGIGCVIKNDHFNQIEFELDLFENFYITGHLTLLNFGKDDFRLRECVSRDAFLLIREDKVVGIIFVSGNGYIGFLPFIKDIDVSGLVKADLMYDSDYLHSCLDLGSE